MMSSLDMLSPKNRENTKVEILKTRENYKSRLCMGSLYCDRFLISSNCYLQVLSKVSSIGVSESFVASRRTYI